MIPVAKRYAPALAVLGAVAAVVVWTHHRGLLDRDDCADPERLRALLQVAPEPSASPATDGNPGVVQRIDGSIAWDDPPKPPLSFAVVRSTDPARLTGRPFHPVLKELEATRRELRWVEGDGAFSLPVHWIYGSVGRRAHFASYLFVYEGRPVRRPTLALAASAPARLLGGARPLTLLVVGGEISTGDVEASRTAAEAWLREAWRSHRLACLSPERVEPRPNASEGVDHALDHR